MSLTIPATQIAASLSPDAPNKIVDPLHQSPYLLNAGNRLIASPYIDRPHQLDLQSLNISERLFARALAILQPLRSDYAMISYELAFNWQTVIDSLRALLQSESYGWTAKHFYIIVFRSRIPPTTDRTHLGELDRISHAEAMQSGGLLKYWFGSPDAQGRNLATCIWRAFEDVKAATGGPGHAAAVGATRSMYTEWKIEKYKLKIGKDAGSWSIDPWEDE